MSESVSVHPPPPPGYPPPPPPWPLQTQPLGPRPPGVWPWFIVYAVVMAIFSLCACGLGAVFFVVPAQELEMEPIEAQIMGGAYIAVGFIFFWPYVIAPFLPKRKWVWIYDLVLICFGMTSCCTLPACIALLIFWIKPQTRQFFGWT